MEPDALSQAYEQFRLGRYLKRHWFHMVHRFPKLLTVAPDDIVQILFRHDRKQIAIDLPE